ncbi:hypothetical protein [uncultured Kordia sp.]|uniref:hypothetical protein n=1 Tax=uncultured Kordia sp. TaxID=507699 RepID=UPI0026302A46|nr:hypothetical protein [uncultured Kordia sp.]
MKDIILLIGFSVIIFYTQSVTGQDRDYDIDMINLAHKTINRVKKENKLVVAVWFFHNTKGEKTELGDFVGRDFSIYFTNIAQKLEVVDRNHIEQLSAEHQWNEEGFIDPATAKEVNKLVAADAIITGTVDYNLHHLRVRIKIIDTETGKQIGAAIKNIRIDGSLQFILNKEYKKDTSSELAAKGILIPEKQNDPRLTTEECEKAKIGDYCFLNNTSDTLVVTVKGEMKNGRNYKTTISKTLKIVPYQNACLFDMKASTYDFMIYRNKIQWRGELVQGTIKVRKCKSFTYTIE